MMKKKALTLLITLTLALTALTACGNTNAVAEDATETADVASVEETTTPAPTETEAPHEHAYAEEVTTPATCEADGVKTFTCECGDTYTEVITATGHTFENYVSNNDATYTADGTETAKCNGCELTDTRTAEGSKLEYTYTDSEATMYAQQTVNVRSMPSTDGEKLGGLNQNDEVKVTGQCNETSWFRIEFDGNVGYVSNNYLGTDKVVVQVNESCPYPLYTIQYDNQGYPYYYGKFGGVANMDADNYAKTKACKDEIINAVGYCGIEWKNIGVYDGMRVVVSYVAFTGPINERVDLPSAEERGIATAGNGRIK